MLGKTSSKRTLAIAKKQKSAENVLLFPPTLDKILESELTNIPEVEENPNDGKSKRGYEKHEKVIVAMEDVALMTRITSSVLSSIVCMYWL